MIAMSELLGSAGEKIAEATSQLLGSAGEKLAETTSQLAESAGEALPTELQSVPVASGSTAATRDAGASEGISQDKGSPSAETSGNEGQSGGQHESLNRNPEMDSSADRHPAQQGNALNANPETAQGSEVERREADPKPETGKTKETGYSGHETLPGAPNARAAESNAFEAADQAVAPDEVHEGDSLEDGAASGTETERSSEASGSAFTTQESPADDPDAFLDRPPEQPPIPEASPPADAPDPEAPAATEAPDSADAPGPSEAPGTAETPDSTEAADQAEAPELAEASDPTEAPATEQVLEAPSEASEPQSEAAEASDATEAPEQTEASDPTEAPDPAEAANTGPDADARDSDTTVDVTQDGAASTPADESTDGPALVPAENEFPNDAEAPASKAAAAQPEASARPLHKPGDDEALEPDDGGPVESEEDPTRAESGDVRPETTASTVVPADPDEEPEPQDAHNADSPHQLEDQPEQAPDGTALARDAAGPDRVNMSSNGPGSGSTVENLSNRVRPPQEGDTEFDAYDPSMGNRITNINRADKGDAQGDVGSETGAVADSRPDADGSPGEGYSWVKKKLDEKDREATDSWERNAGTPQDIKGAILDALRGLGKHVAADVLAGGSPNPSDWFSITWKSAQEYGEAVVNTTETPSLHGGSSDAVRAFAYGWKNRDALIAQTSNSIADLRTWAANLRTWAADLHTWITSHIL